MTNPQRDERQRLVSVWAEQAFGAAQTTSIPQRALRLLEEAVELYQAAGCPEDKAHELVTFVFKRPVGVLAQEMGGVGVCLLVLGTAAGISADEREQLEVERIMSKPISHFTVRNQAKNEAGFLLAKHDNLFGSEVIACEVCTAPLPPTTGYAQVLADEPLESVWLVTCQTCTTLHDIVHARDRLVVKRATCKHGVDDPRSVANPALRCTSCFPPIQTPEIVVVDHDYLSAGDMPHVGLHPPLGCVLCGKSRKEHRR